MNAKIKSHAKTITKFFTCYNIVACLWSMGKRGKKSQRKKSQNIFKLCVFSNFRVDGKKRTLYGLLNIFKLDLQPTKYNYMGFLCKTDCFFCIFVK